MNIPDKALEAAADAYCRTILPYGLDKTNTQTRNAMLDDARRILEAVNPIITAHTMRVCADDLEANWTVRYGPRTPQAMIKALRDGANEVEQ